MKYSSLEVMRSIQGGRVCVSRKILFWERKKTVQVENARSTLELDFPLGGVSVGFGVRE